jgi:Protein of unknown function (DUF3142)
MLIDTPPHHRFEVDPMSLAGSFPLLQSRTRKLSLIVLLLAAAFFTTALNRPPRPWPASQTPVVFWAWHDHAPSPTDVSNAVQRLATRAIFIRAGQIDWQNGKLQRIRAVTGTLPQGIDVHLVYNGTRQLLADLDRIDESQLANTINSAYEADVLRSAKDQVRVVGLQIDLDVPTRLLGKYEKTLKVLRAQLKPGAQLSITGLPTWMQSRELRSTLAQVDFWTPQLYGLELPERLDQSIPISSPATISSFVDQARELDEPYYAGLAAYSWTLLYSSSGYPISLRGDMDPALIAADANLELIEQRQFAGAPGEWRYVYRVKADGVTDQLAMRAGDVLVVDVPSSESLRVAARAVRERAGAKLKGICVFRLPATDDLATLTLEQVAPALSDVDSRAQVEVEILSDVKSLSRPPASSPAYTIVLRNVGTESSTIGRVKIDLQMSPGTIENWATGSATVEFLCGTLEARDTNALGPCSQRRANVLRIKPRILAAGQSIRLQLTLNSEPQKIPVRVEMETDTGRSYLDWRVVQIESR